MAKLETCMNTESAGAVVLGLGCVIVFGASVTAMVLGVNVGQYGSPVAATIFSSIGVTGVVRLLARSGNAREDRNESLVRTGVLGCTTAGVVLLNPLPSTVGLVALVGALGTGLSGSVLVGHTVYP